MAESCSSSKRKITLKSGDDQCFEVDEDVALQSIAIKNTFEEISGSDPIPLPNVTSNVLAKVIEYCNNKTDHSDSSSTLVKDDLKEFEADFVKGLKADHDLLFDLISAANYLNIQSLLDLTCKCVADIIRGKNPQQIRKIFHIKNDYTPEEEEEIKKELSWAFE